MTAATTYKRPTGTFLTTGEPNPNVNLRNVRDLVGRWYLDYHEEIAGYPAAHPEIARIGDHLSTALKAIGAGRGDVSAFLKKYRERFHDQPSSIEKVERVESALIRTGVILPQDAGHIPADYLPDPPPNQPYQAAPAAAAPRPRPNGTATPSPPEDRHAPTFSEPSGADIIPKRFSEEMVVTPRGTRTSNADETGTNALLQLTFSGQSICCLAAPGLDTHGVLLLLLYLLMGNTKAVAPITPENLHIFDAEGNPYLGYEDEAGIVRQSLDVDVQQPMAEWLHWLDIMWDAYHLVRERRRLRQSQSAGQRGGSLLQFDPALFVLPSWSTWAMRWSKYNKNVRKVAIDNWVAYKQESMPNFRFNEPDFFADQMLFEILQFGPKVGVRLLISANINECDKSTGLTTAVLPSFATVAVGQYLNSGASFGACDKLLRIMDDSERDRVQPWYQQARQLVRKADRGLLIVNASEANVWPCPDCSYLQHRTRPPGLPTTRFRGVA